MRKYYELLGVNENVEPRDLRIATRKKMAYVYLNQTSDVFLEVATAYVVLANKEEKERYDQATDDSYVFENHGPDVMDPNALCEKVTKQFVEKSQGYYVDTEGAVTGLFLWSLALVALIVLTIGSYTHGNRVVVYYGAMIVIGGNIIRDFNVLKDARNAKKYSKNVNWEDIEL